MPTFLDVIAKIAKSVY